MGLLKISRLTNQEKGFYLLMGPFLSRRSIVSELGSPVWDDDGKEWFIATIRNKVVGFAAVKNSGSYHSLVSAYVLPENRRRGIYRQLLMERLKSIGEGPVKSTASPASVRALQSVGFKIVRKRGMFTVMERA